MLWSKFCNNRRNSYIMVHDGQPYFGGYLNSINLGSPPSLIISTSLITTLEQQQLEVAMNNWMMIDPFWMKGNKQQWGF